MKKSKYNMNLSYKERSTLYKRKYRNSIRGKNIRKKYRYSKAGINTQKKWRNSNKGKESIRNYINKYPFYKKVGDATRNKYGKLNDKRLEYHHYKPYHKDKFIILEKGLHKWMHKHPKSFKISGLNPTNQRCKGVN